MTLIYRSVKGSRLTSAEADGNIHDLDDRLTTIEINPPEAVSIAEITSDGNSITVVLTDASQFGPFAIPAPTLNFRGEWAAATIYLANDIFTINGSVYIVLQNHTSAGSFDAGASETAGDLYGLLLSQPSNTLPTGGQTAMRLAKQSGADYDTEWVFDYLSGLTDVDIGTDLAAGQSLVWSGSIWTNGAPSLALDDLTDVVISSTALAENDVIAFDGAQFVNAPLESLLLQLKRQTVSSSSHVLTINRLLGEICKLTLTENITSIIVNNWPSSGIFGRILLEITNPASYTVTGYPSNTAGGTAWAGGTQPTITIAATSHSGRDRIILSTDDAGATVTGDVVGQDYF